MGKNKNKKTIHIAADHRGYCLKFSVKKYLTQLGYEVIDHGNHQYQSRDDYPVFAKKLLKAVKHDQFGILICGSGAGMVIIANKPKYSRAAVCWNSQVAQAVRHDDDVQILVLPADFITAIEANKTVRKFINTPFSNKSKNKRRLEQINKLEKC